MVKVTLVDENAQPSLDNQEEKIVLENDQDYSDTESEHSDEEEEFDDEYDLEGETLVDRLVALKDILPPQYRSKLSSTFSGIYNTASSGLSFGGKALWILTTSSLLLGVPLSLSIISEQQLIEMEKEMKLTQSTNEVLAPGAEQGFQAPPSQPR